MVEIFGGLILLSLIIGAWIQIPMEDPEIQIAREFYGKI